MTVKPVVQRGGVGGGGNNPNPEFENITLTNTSDQIILGTGTTITVNSATPAANSVYDIPDVGTSADFVMTEGGQTINGLKTFDESPVINSANSFVPCTNVVTLTRGVINTTGTIITGVTGRQIRLLNLIIRVTGNFLGGPFLLEVIDSSGNIIMVYPAGGLTDGTVATTANFQYSGENLGLSAASGDSIQVRPDASTFSNGTSIDFISTYTLE